MKRLILNYSNSCNLNCDFCYLSFCKTNTIDKTDEIINKAKVLGFNVITFSGGDPFSQVSFKNCCNKAKAFGFYTHVDTNGLEIKKEDFDFILGNIDLLGISIDGLYEVHNSMRKKANLFGHLESVLFNSMKEKIPVKINTIVTKQNYKEIYKLGLYLRKYTNISRWSLYQFFPLDSAKNKKDLFEIDDETFINLIHKIEKNSYSFIVESLMFSKRVTGYIFSDEQGRIYTNNILGMYEYIGSIFDENIVEKLDQKSLSINPVVKNRYI